MRAVTSIAAILAVAWTTGCGSANDSGEASGSARTDAAKQALKNFYAAANDADGGRACGYLTMDGIRQIVPGLRPHGRRAFTWKLRRRNGRR